MTGRGSGDAGLIRRSAGNPVAMGSSLISAVHGADLSTLFIVLALLCFGLAAYAAYIGNVVAAVVLVFIAVVVLIV